MNSYAHLKEVVESLNNIPRGFQNLTLMSLTSLESYTEITTNLPEYTVSP